MLRLSATWANRLWLFAQSFEQRRFWNQAAQLEAVQERLLRNYLRRNANTAFGRDFGFSTIKNYADYAQRVPLLEDWSQVEPYIQRIANGESGVLTAGKVLGFEETSGTTGSSKWIPYTPALKVEFGRAIAVWMCGIRDACPEAFFGSAYWSISPALKEKRKSPAGLPVGLASDTDYFDPLTAYLLRFILLVPKVFQETEHRRFYRKTLEKLLESRDLRFVSLWSPTFLIQLDRVLREETDLLRVKGLSPDADWATIFPTLALFSCWTDAQASVWMDRVQQILGNIPVQGKGLLATEGVSSIPVGLTGKRVLAYRSHFFEFLDAENGRVCLAHQLEQGRLYETILTTGGGLYRYCTRDLVRVEGELKGLPALRFEGRSGAQSDLCGEKLSEAQVLQAFQTSGAMRHCAELFIQAERVPETGQGRYTLLFYGLEKTAVPEKMLAQIETELRKNPYFRQAQDLRQLLPLQYRIEEKSILERLKRYYAVEKKIKEGDQKIGVMIRESFPAKF